MKWVWVMKSSEGLFQILAFDSGCLLECPHMTSPLAWAFSEHGKQVPQPDSWETESPAGVTLSFYDPASEVVQRYLLCEAVSQAFWSSAPLSWIMAKFWKGMWNQKYCSDEFQKVSVATWRKWNSLILWWEYKLTILEKNLEK